MTNLFNTTRVMLGAPDIGDSGALDRLKDNLTSLFNEFYPYIIAILSSFVFLWAIYIGIKWWQAGNQEKQREAKEYLKNFIVGILLIFVVGAAALALIGFLSDWVTRTSG
jgi:hypothetical protein